ncbi:MAG TPA: cytochrome c-type biogenesis protein [Burkholderiales bacterium]|nr:cytochrome c-type biogenesis protein [Burkholderiales bacterium]
MIAAALFLSAASGIVSGKEAAPLADDPELEARTTQVASELRCLVCQNQTIADSQAGLAIDLKNQIREQLRQGATEAQIKQYMVQRYGDFVLYNPPVKTTTWLLWFGPFLLMVLGIAALIYTLLKRNRGARSVGGNETNTNSVSSRPES